MIYLCILFLYLNFILYLNLFIYIVLYTRIKVCVCYCISIFSSFFSFFTLISLIKILYSSPWWFQCQGVVAESENIYNCPMEGIRNGRSKINELDDSEGEQLEMIELVRESVRLIATFSLPVVFVFNDLFISQLVSNCILFRNVRNAREKRRTRSSHLVIRGILVRAIIRFSEYVYTFRVPGYFEIL